MTAECSNLSDFLDGLAATCADRPAVVGERDALTFAALDRAADEWARAFVAAGFGAGSHVGLLAGNSPGWLAVAFGAWRAAATLVPISTFVTARELGEILAHADVNALVVHPAVRSHDYLAMLQRLPPLPQLQTIVVLGDRRTAHRSAAEFLAAGSTAHRHEGAGSDSIACILYTSGTTGQPKGVMLSHRAILATVLPTAERTGLTSADALLSSLPLFWVAGLVIRALPTLATGCALHLVETFTTDAVIAMLQRHRITAVHWRPPQVGTVLAHPDFTPELLARVHRGGGRIEWFGDTLARDARFITGYGMTEMSGYVTALSWNDPADARRTQLGRPVPGVEMRIVDSGGAVLPPGQIGEIHTRGPGLFSGYYKQPPSAGLTPDRWFATGDLGRIDADDTFHFIGRTKDLLRVKGINVSPMEVENVLATHAAVEAVYVVGLPADALEHDLVAVIVAKSDDHAAIAAQLRALAADALSHYKRPEHYVFIGRGDVPLGGTSKPQRAALTELASQKLQALLGAQRAVPPTAIGGRRGTTGA
ncbi:MAG TPA: class I adenylate-forming enzyme family protein [Candidatus Binatia bacterium]|nr:class I adenylate-forming enzyme family protein [Candidatus Binatia bacterium]